MIKEKLYLLFVFVFCAMGFSAQTLSLADCQEKTKINYPLVRDYDLLEKSKDYSIKSAQTAYLPRISVSAYSTYQNETIEFPTATGADPLRKDHHRITGEVVQPITSLFNVKNKKHLVEVSAASDRQQIEIEMYQLEERVNQIYFGILLIEEQMGQLVLYKDDIQNGIDKLDVAIENGIALKSSADILRVELLKADQQLIVYNSSKKSFIDALGLLMNEAIPLNTQFLQPVMLVLDEEINRPELELFSFQQEALGVQEKMLTYKVLPQFNLFFQGGYGAPGLNMIDNDPAGLYITGLRLNWDVSGFYTNSNEKKVLKLGQDRIAVKQDVFLFNVALGLKRKGDEIQKMKDLVASDDQIIQMRESITKTYQSQLENGAVTSNDYLLQVNEANRAKKSQLLHQLQLLLAQYEYNTISGNSFSIHK